MASGLPAKPFTKPVVTGGASELDGDLFLFFSGQFSFCAAVSTATALTAEDAEGVEMFFCCFFFLLALEAAGSGGLGGLGGVGGVGAAAGFGLLLPSLTVSREEISNMVGTERNCCCVSPRPSSSDDGGERADTFFPLSPTFFFLLDDEAEVEEDRG